MPVLETRTKSARSAKVNFGVQILLNRIAESDISRDYNVTLLPEFSENIDELMGLVEILFP